MQGEKPGGQSGQNALGAGPDDDPYLPKVPAAKKKKKRWPKVVIALSLVLVLLGGAAFFVLRYLDDVFEPGEFGIIKPLAALLDNDTIKPYSKKDLLHILIVGIDNEEGRDYGAGLGLTDMLLYCKFDIKNNSLTMMQIPRDSYVGEEYNTGGSGKINALLISGSDKDHPINNLTTAFQEQFKLPLDYYVALDMDAMKLIVDTFGGIKVYVPRDMSHGGSALEQGWRWMNGETAEFFVRNRYGAGFERADLDRLDNQRHFYSALFRRFMNLQPQDIPGLLSVFHHYANTDIGLSDLFSIAVAALSLDSEKVIFFKVPGATGSEADPIDPTGRGRNLYLIDLYGRGTEEDPGLAALMNQYLRDAEYPVAAEELGLPQHRVPDRYALYPPNAQGMGEVMASEEGGADVNVEPTAEVGGG